MDRLVEVNQVSPDASGAVWSAMRDLARTCDGRLPHNVAKAYQAVRAEQLLAGDIASPLTVELRAALVALQSAIGAEWQMGYHTHRHRPAVVQHRSDLHIFDPDRDAPHDAGDPNADDQHVDAGDDHGSPTEQR
jgi:hypothetical protein